MRYQEIKTAIDQAPMTWVPALLVAVVRRAVSLGVFQDNGLLVTVEKAMRDETETKNSNRVDEKESKQ